MKKKKKVTQAQLNETFSIDILFVLILFFLYAASALVVSLIGANIYSNTVATSQRNYNVRTSVLYITEKVRQSETVDGVRIDSALGSDALVLSLDLDGEIFETWIYVENEQLTEVFVPKDTPIVPNIGQNIMPLKSMTLENENGNLINVEVVTEEDITYSSAVYLDTQ